MFELLAYREPGQWDCGSENIEDRLNFWLHALLLKDLQEKPAKQVVQEWTKT